ncbi:MAG: tetratricopeptide repeat protein [Sandaracinaceae bacterium]|nr:tetratricopeptide repeat protein [Sandaracinaceae bacterium]
MAALTVSQCLGMLLEDPDSQVALDGLLDALTSGKSERLGQEPIRLIEAARHGHAMRGESWTVGKLIELELEVGAKDPDREAAMWKELGRIRHDELLDDVGSRAAYEKAAALRPGDHEVQDALEQLAQVADNWKDIAKRFSDEAENASDPNLRTSLLVRAASLIWQYKKRGRDKEVDALFREALESDPSDTRAALLYEQTLRAREEWAENAKILLNAAESAKNRDEKLNLYIRAARVFRARLHDRERAANCYERVLDFSPGQPEAMSFLVAYFTEKEEWDHLVAVYEDALRSRQKVDSEQGILLQLGMVQWRMRAKPEDAEPYFARLRKFDPAHPAMLDFYREYLGKSGDEARLLTILGDAQRTSSDTGNKLKLAIEVARAAQDNPATLERGIDAWKAVQRLDPENSEAQGALVDLYRRAGKWNALVEALKADLESKREGSVESRVAILREMVAVYRDRLNLDVMVINTYNAILQILPDDEEALGSLSSTYESLGRWNDLIQVLTRQADATTNNARKVDLYTRVANL